LGYTENRQHRRWFTPGSWSVDQTGSCH